jgi:hypothetical protein
MKIIFTFVRCVVVASLLQYGFFAFAQVRTDLSGSQEAFRSSVTGAGTGSDSRKAAKSGGADGKENLLL